MSVGELCKLSDHSPIQLSIKCLNHINNTETQPDVSEVNLSKNEENKVLQKYKTQHYVTDASAL